MSGLDISPDTTPEEILEHYGMKGMKWGKRKASDAGSSSEGGGGSSSSSSKGLSDGQKKALKIGGAALVAGIVITGVVIAKKGNVSVGDISSKLSFAEKFAKDTAGQRVKAAIPMTAGPIGKASLRERAGQAKEAAQTAAKGKQVLDQVLESEAFQQKVSDFRSQIADAHREQTKRMIDDSANSGIPYDAARDNPYSPEARR